MAQVPRTPLSGPRLRQLQGFLCQLGIDPGAPDGPGLAAEALAPVEEALSHTSAGLARNHEQLEFLGDAVLRLAAAEFLARRHSQLGVGQRSALRAQLVSDRWLAERAEAIDLARLIHLGPLALGDRSGRATVLAECCEALVGGVYQAWGGPRGGLEAVLRWLEPAWEEASAELLADPERHNWKTALQEWSQGQGVGLPHYQTQETNRRHGDPQRFRATVHCHPPGDAGPVLCAGEGWGGSRREAEQQAARAALAQLRRPAGPSGAG
jgi:ribonuclease-3